jgi:hypothetical protein
VPHAELFRVALEATGVDSGHPGCLDSAPDATLSNLNLETIFALHRCWRAAHIGPVALHEMYLGSVRNYVVGFERCGMNGVIV